ncbi:PREDICTED: uncharacterized protein LOC109332510 [Lupinus angustifolius]|uniref:uncharacterized protein LOC109332510 n=1 Tax=Lupinus angustifolius TaxID=3871 RepID=UPI00092E8193|nr:PREDICTED: uncharacterized protein LOC109332510 [Lupinus angustifolius]
MQQPAGFQHSDKTLVCKLHKVIYGLKQPPRQWFERLKGSLLQFEFYSCRCDNSLFIRTSSDFQLYVLVYVDDIIVTGSSPSMVSKVIKDLSTTFSLNQLGKLDYFLGIEVKHISDGTLLMSQIKYISNLLTRANMDTTKPMPSPMASNCKLSQEGNDLFEDPTFYRSIVGALQYATVTRSDIAFSVNKVCQILGKPLQSHWTVVKRILKYLQGTVCFGLNIGKAHNHTPLALSPFCDVG